MKPISLLNKELKDSLEHY